MNQSEKQALAWWEEFHRSMQSNIFVDTSLAAHEVEALRLQLEADPIRWIQHIFPAYAKYPSADFQKKAILRIIEHEEWYEVLSWARSLAKSTVAMFALLYLALTGRKKFIICASATEDAAIRLLTPYRVALTSNPRYVNSMVSRRPLVPGRKVSSQLDVAVCSSPWARDLLLVVLEMSTPDLTCSTSMTTIPMRTVEIKRP